MLAAELLLAFRSVKKQRKVWMRYCRPMHFVQPAAAAAAAAFGAEISVERVALSRLLRPV